MKILVAGFPKTGTTSMAVALRKLGYKVYDFEEHFFYLGDQWNKIFTEGGTVKDFYEMYKDVDAATDMPTCMFWEELLEAFPDVKIILTQRKNEDEWWNSWKKQVDTINSKPVVKLLYLLSPTMRKAGMHAEYVKHVTFSGGPKRFFLDDFVGFSPTVSKMRYREHNAAVVARAPKDKLLQYDVSEGWEPLCEFLGLAELPQIPFPHVNVGGENVDQALAEHPMFLKIKAEAKLSLAVIVVVLAIMVYVVLHYFVYSV